MRMKRNIWSNCLIVLLFFHYGTWECKGKQTGMDPIERLSLLVPGNGSREGGEKMQPFNRFSSHHVIWNLKWFFKQFFSQLNWHPESLMPLNLQPGLLPNGGLWICWWRARGRGWTSTTSGWWLILHSQVVPQTKCRVGYFENGNSHLSPTSHFSDAMWEIPTQWEG